MIIIRGGSCMGDNHYINGFFITKGERPDEWIVSRNGNDHIIYCEKGKKLKDCKLFVDNEEIELPSDFITRYIAIDYPVQIEGKVIRCVCERDLPERELVEWELIFDLVICGEYLNRNATYYPTQKGLPIIGIMLLYMLTFLVLGMGFGIELLPPIGELTMHIIVVVSLSLYLEYLRMKEKKGEYSIINEEQRQIKRHKRRIWTMHILAFLSVIAMVVAVTVMNIEMPIIIWILMWLWFIGGGRYVVHLWKKVRELERESR